MLGLFIIRLGHKDHIALVMLPIVILPARTGIVLIVVVVGGVIVVVVVGHLVDILRPSPVICGPRRCIHLVRICTHGYCVCTRKWCRSRLQGNGLGGARGVR